MFDERQRVADERKAAREAQNGALHKGARVFCALCMLCVLRQSHGMALHGSFCRRLASALAVHRRTSFHWVPLLRPSPAPVCLLAGTPAQREWAAQLLQQGQTKAELPALADGRAILMPHTSLENTLISQPQASLKASSGFLFWCWCCVLAVRSGRMPGPYQLLFVQAQPHIVLLVATIAPSYSPLCTNNPHLLTPLAGARNLHDYVFGATP